MPKISSKSKQILLAVKASVEPFSPVVVAFSGGLDSTVLLHACAQLKELPADNKKWLAVYVNHQLSKNSDSWQQHCATIASSLSFPFQVVTVDVDRSKASLEAVARSARYAALEQFLEQGAVLLTAHHADDQAETLLLRLMRGAGVAGLRGIHRTRRQGMAELTRPLLDFSRQDLVNYAEEFSLSWIEDESNDNTQYDRNYLRRDLMPLLKQRWPDAAASIGEVTKHVAEQQTLLEEIARADLESITGENFYGYYLDLRVLESLGLARAKNAIRFWMAANGGSFNREQWRQFEALIVRPERQTVNKGLSTINSKLCVSDVVRSDVTSCGVGDHEVEYRAYDNKLYICPVELFNAESEEPRSGLLKIQPELYSWDTQFGHWELGVTAAEQERSTESPASNSLEIALDDLNMLKLQTACSFEDIKLNGKNQQLKKIFQARRVPQWWRASYPAISAQIVGDQIVGDQIRSDLINSDQSGDETRLLTLLGIAIGDHCVTPSASADGSKLNRVIISWSFSFTPAIRAFFNSLEKCKDN